MKSNRAFTLIELLVVMSIISMISSTLLVTLQNARDKGKIASVVEFEAFNYHKVGAYSVGKWNLDDAQNSTTANDIGGNGLVLNLNGCGASPFSPNTSPLGTASTLSLNGTCYATWTGSGPLLVGSLSKGFTVSNWIKFSNVSGPTSVVLDLYGKKGAVTGNIFQEYLDLSSSPQLVYNYFSAPAASACGTGPVDNSFLKAGIWNHIVFDANGTNQTIYVNGKSVAIYPCSLSVPTDTFVTTVTLGAQKNGAVFSNYFTGNLSNVAIYGEALTASQVREIYAQGLKTHQVADVSKSKIK